MKATTPPKLIPPFHRTAASGMFPTEHTKEIIATNGPTIGPQNSDKVGCEVRKKERQKLSGTQAASAPAIINPNATSKPDRYPVHHEVMARAVRPLADKIRRKSGPSVMAMSISA